MDNLSNDDSKFYGSFLDKKDSEIFKTNIETIKIDYNYSHYFCTNCLKFPFIKFCKDRKTIRLTCCCFNNKKILIEELFKTFSIEDSLLIFLSETNLTHINENELMCKKHNKKFKGFSKFFLNNYCEDCDNYKDEINDNDIIRFDDIKIDEKKIKEIIEKINDNKYLEEEIYNNIRINKNNDIYIEFSREEDRRFKKLINIILNDYINYPNVIHFFNIINILDFFNIKEEEENIIDDNLVEKNEPIIIEYINNISNKTKLFSKTFVKNNKKNFKIEIEGRRLDLIEDYEFKTKEKKVKVKLFKNKNYSEINMFKMFSNCTNLIYVNGISKLNKIVNINKIFYNCISLSSIPDFNDWEIKKYKAYLMFYNCISLIFFPYAREFNINKYDQIFLGILITKYLKFNKEIIINNINEDDKGYINLFNNTIKLEDKNKEIMMLDGKDDERELIACFTYDVKEYDDELIVFYNNENNDGYETRIKIIIINKIKDMNRIIERKELELTKWNINNVKNLARLFYECKSLSSLPDISKWNTNNVTDISYLFYGCESLSFLPDISKWNTNNAIDISCLFYGCESLSFLPDISKWNTNNATDISYLFYGCKSLKLLPDISKWNTNNVINMQAFFDNCESLSSLPDISKWNTNNVTDISYLFYGCKSYQNGIQLISQI